MNSFSYILVKGFVKTFSQKFYNTKGSLYIIKKKNSLITRSIITNINIINRKELFHQQMKQRKRLRQEGLKIILIKLKDGIEKAIIEEEKNKILSLYVTSKQFYRDYDVDLIPGGSRNILSSLIKDEKVETAMKLIKFIDQKDKIIIDLVHVFIELFEDYEKDYKKFYNNYKISLLLWNNINLYRINNIILNDDLLKDLITNFYSKIRSEKKNSLIKPFLKGMISSGIKNENICLNLFNDLLIKQTIEEYNDYNENIIIGIYKIFKDGGIKFNDDIFKNLLILQQRRNNINNLTFFYRDMISVYAEKELDENGFKNLQLIEDSFKEGKVKIAIKYYHEIPTKDIKSNPIILFELFKGLFESKIENSLISSIFNMIKKSDIKINSDIGYFLMVGFLWNDGLKYAERILQEMMELKIIPPAHAFILLMRSYWKNEMINKSEKLLELIKFIDIREYSYYLRLLLIYYNKKKDKDGIYRWINELMKFTDEDFKIRNFPVLMLSYGILGKLSNTLELWEELNEKYSGEVLSSAISVLLDQIGIYGDITTLKKYWKLFINDSNDKYILNLNHFNSYIEALCRFKAFDEAIKVFKVDIISNGFEPTLKTVITLLHPLITNRHNEKDNILYYIKMQWPNLHDEFIKFIMDYPDRFKFR